MEQMIRPERLCLRCMKEVPEGSAICPACGFDPEKYEYDPHQLPPLEILKGRYLVGTVIGEGGFGITYSAWDLISNRHVAIKELFISAIVKRHNQTVVITDHSQEGENYFLECREKFMQEGEVLAAMKDKAGVVDIYDYFAENGTAYLVMEFLKGDDLLTHLKKNGGSVSYPDAFNMLRPVMKSLIEIHNAGIIHRDISPDNIRCMPDHRMKLMDFGSAKFTNKTSNSMLVLVKAGYAPPEQYVQNYMIGAWIDVYEMAATIYRCITGTPPKPSPARQDDRDLKKPSEFGVEIPPEAEKVLLKGMALNIADRYQNMYEFYVALKKASIGGEPRTGVLADTPETPAPLPEEAPEGPDFKLRAVILLAAVVQALIIAVILSYVLR